MGGLNPIAIKFNGQKRGGARDGPFCDHGAPRKSWDFQSIGLSLMGTRALPMSNGSARPVTGVAAYTSAVRDIGLHFEPHGRARPLLFR